MRKLVGSSLQLGICQPAAPHADGNRRRCALRLGSDQLIRPGELGVGLAGAVPLLENLVHLGLGQQLVCS